MNNPGPDFLCVKTKRSVHPGEASFFEAPWKLLGWSPPAVPGNRAPLPWGSRGRLPGRGGLIRPVRRGGVRGERIGPHFGQPGTTWHNLGQPRPAPAEQPEPIRTERTARTNPNTPNQSEHPEPIRTPRTNPDGANQAGPPAAATGRRGLSRGDCAPGAAPPARSVGRPFTSRPS